MKKYLVLGLLVLSFLVATPALAQTVDNSALIQQLLQQLLQLQTQLIQLLQQQGHQQPLPQGQPSITVLSPNGGEVWFAGGLSSHSVEWRTSGLTNANRNDVYRVSLVTEGGNSSLLKTVQNTAIKGDSTFGFDWTIPVGTQAGNYKISVQLIGENGQVKASDDSDNYFQIKLPPSYPAGSFDVTPTTVNSGSGATFSYGLPSGAVSPQLYFSCQAGIQVDPSSNQNVCGQWLALDPARNQRAILFRNTGSQPAIVYVTYNYQETLQGPGHSTSRNVTVNPGTPVSYSVTVLSPNGGETFSRNDTITIRWDTSSPGGARGIDLTNIDTHTGSLVYRVQNGQTDQGITSGSYDLNLHDISWITPGRYKISVYTLFGGSGSDALDSSDNYFTITSGTPQPSITVISPNGGETFHPDQALTLKWSSVNLSPSASIGSLIINENGEVFGLLSSVPNTGSYTVPRISYLAEPDGKYKLKLFCDDRYSNVSCGSHDVNGSANVSDQSDGFFNIVSN